MLYFTRWKALAIILTALVVCLFAVPNFFPQEKVKTWPVWAQRHIVLGLDLQGGSYLLLQIDSNSVKKDRLEQVVGEVRRVLRDAKVGFTGLAIRNDAVEVRVKDTDLQVALPKLRELSQPLGGLLGSSGQRSLEVSDVGGGLIRLTVPQAAITERIRQTNEQSIQIVERRINQLGTVEPLIQRQGVDRILVQVPGLQDPTELNSHSWHDRQDGIPHGGSVDLAGSGPAGACARRLGSPDERGVAEGALRRQDAGSGFRRRPHRCAAGLRPAYQ